MAFDYNNVDLSRYEPYKLIIEGVVGGETDESMAVTDPNDSDRVRTWSMSQIDVNGTYTIDPDDAGQNTAAPLGGGNGTTRDYKLGSFSVSITEKLQEVDYEGYGFPTYTTISETTVTESMDIWVWQDVYNDWNVRAISSGSFRFIGLGEDPYAKSFIGPGIGAPMWEAVEDIGDGVLGSESTFYDYQMGLDNAETFYLDLPDSIGGTSSEASDPDSTHTFAHVGPEGTFQLFIKETGSQAGMGATGQMAINTGSMGYNTIPTTPGSTYTPPLNPSQMANMPKASTTDDNFSDTSKMGLPTDSPPPESTTPGQTTGGICAIGNSRYPIMRGTPLSTPGVEVGYNPFDPRRLQGTTLWQDGTAPAPKVGITPKTNGGAQRTNMRTTGGIVPAPTLSWTPAKMPVGYCRMNLRTGELCCPGDPCYETNSTGNAPGGPAGQFPAIMSNPPGGSLATPSMPFPCWYFPEGGETEWPTGGSTTPTTIACNPGGPIDPNGAAAQGCTLTISPPNENPGLIWCGVGMEEQGVGNPENLRGGDRLGGSDAAYYNGIKSNALIGLTIGPEGQVLGTAVWDTGYGLLLNHTYPLSKDGTEPASIECYTDGVGQITHCEVVTPGLGVCTPSPSANLPEPGDDGETIVLSCFLPGTRVNTPSGYTNIEDLIVGSEVVSYDTEIKEFVISTVTDTITANADSILKVDIISERNIHEPIYVTAEHPFYINEAWCNIGEAVSGGELLYAHRDAPVIISNIETIPGDAVVHNITVDTYHNYFANDILCHNKSYWWPPNPNGGGLPPILTPTTSGVVCWVWPPSATETTTTIVTCGWTPVDPPSGDPGLPPIISCGPFGPPPEDPTKPPPPTGPSGKWPPGGGGGPWCGVCLPITHVNTGGGGPPVGPSGSPPPSGNPAPGIRREYTMLPDNNLIRPRKKNQVYSSVAHYISRHDVRRYTIFNSGYKNFIPTLKGIPLKNGTKYSIPTEVLLTKFNYTDIGDLPAANKRVYSDLGPDWQVLDFSDFQGCSAIDCRAILNTYNIIRDYKDRTTTPPFIIPLASITYGGTLTALDGSFYYLGYCNGVVPAWCEAASGIGDNYFICASARDLFRPYMAVKVPASAIES